MLGSFLIRRWLSKSAVSNCAAIRRECVGGVCWLDAPTGSTRRVAASRSSSSAVAVARDDNVRGRRSSWSRLNAMTQSARSASSSAGGIGEKELRKRMDEISEKFAEALEMINDAKASVGTVYFSEDMNEAKELVEGVLSSFQSLVEQADEVTKRKVQAAIGLKIEELKAQMDLLHAMLKD